MWHGHTSTIVCLILCILLSATQSFSLFKSSNSQRAFVSQPPQVSTAPNDFNAVHVAKTGGRGTKSTSQEALEKNLSLGAPGDLPESGEYVTKGGVGIKAQVDVLTFEDGTDGLLEGSSARAIEDLVERLDSEKGVLLSSSYEFPGRYVFES